MKTLKLLALVAVLGLASLASAQTLTRSLVLKPSGSTGTATITSGSIGLLGDSYTLTLPAGGRAQTGPILKQTNSAVGDKPMVFGQIDLSSNAATTGDITGTLGVTNGGTGLSNAPINSILYASGVNTYSSLSPGTTGQVLGNVSGVPTWGTTLGGSGATTNISNTGAGNTTNINGPTATGGSVTIGNATSTNTIAGTTTFTGTVSLPLTTNNVWTGVGNVATELPPTAGAIFVTAGLGNLVPQWSTTLPTGISVPFNQISSGVNTTATMDVGNGASLIPSGTGIIAATRFTGTGSTTNAVDLATAEVNGVLPIANGGTNSTTIGALGTVTYSTGAAYASTAAGTTGQILQANTGGAPTWTNVGNLLAAASFSLTAVAADVTNGYFTVNTTTVPTLVTGYGFDASSRVIVTLEATSGFAQGATVTDRAVTSFRVYTGAIAVGDVINVVIIDTTP
jgi:hypothetical protein